MFWPTPQDYREAIQNPRNCFQDPELQAGLPELDKLGLPRPISGSFASVYKIKCGQTDWAVRCFTNNVKDQKVRYDAISLHLSSVDLPYIVPFEYLSEGIRINGSWFPVVKMLWVEGESLLPYIRRNLHNDEILRTLADNWLKMVVELQSANIAHGDLQHGNILIRNDELILIDYDGMYVPGLDGMHSNELGHRNYQHPGRNEEHFGPYIDNFSAWVIWISIEAVCADASLWDSLGAGEAEESLLFRQKDFVAPDESRAFELLELAQDETLRALAAAFRDVTTVEVAMVPLPFTPEPPADAAHTPASSPAAAAGLSAHLTSLLNWFAGKRLIAHLTSCLTPLSSWFAGKMRIATVQPQPDLSYPARSAWVLDHLTTEAIPSKPLPQNGYIIERTASALLIIIIVLAATLYGNSSVTALVSCIILGLGVETAFISWRYRKLPAFKEKGTTSKKIKELQHEIFDLTSDLKENNDSVQKFKQTEEEKIKDILQRQKEVSEQEKDETDDVEKELRIHISEIAVERQIIDQEEKKELAGALASFQKNWLEAQLMKHKISREKIPDIDDETKRGLSSSGICTPADFLDIIIFQSYGRKKIEKAYLILKNGGSVHVGISPSQAKTLVEWKKRIERRYRAKIPQSMPHHELTAIKSTYNGRRSTLNNAEQTYRTKAQHMINNIRRTYTPEHDRLKKEEDTARTDLIHAVNEFDKEASEINRSLAEKQWELYYLSKQMNALKDVNFLRFVRRVFLFH